MERDAILATIRAHEAELKTSGVLSLSLFGSVARNEAGIESDIDVAVGIDRRQLSSGFAYFGAIERIESRLASILGRPVDVVVEPVRRSSLKHAIEKDRLVAF